MNSIDLLEPELLYVSQLKDQHHENVINFLGKLVERAGTDKEANRKTCKDYYDECAHRKVLAKKEKKLAALKGFFIFLCLLIAGIFLLIFVYKPKKKALDAEIEECEIKMEALLNEAWNQMATLNALFDSSIPAKIMQTTTPLIQMDRIFDVKKYEMMREKYGLWDNSDDQTSTLNLQSGSILGNPFVVFKDLNQSETLQRYEGSLTISYTVGSGDSRRTVTETLHAHVDKPKPVYSEETYLVYGNEAAPRLSFSRNPSDINSMDDKQREKYVRKHEGDLQKLAEKVMKKGGTYTPLGNPEFELFFGGLDRDNEVEFRLLFTPLAQKSMLQVLKSDIGYGDDFRFVKDHGLNLVVSKHSQGTTLFVNAEDFVGFDYELVEDFFIRFNDNYFKALFFDFAPLLCIPLYQQHKPHEYIYKNNVGSNFNCFEHEVLANKFNPDMFKPANAKTDVILKTFIGQKSGSTDIVNVASYSFDAVERVDYIPVRGGDGYYHDVPVYWIEYIPVTGGGQFSVNDLGTDDEAKFRSLGQEGVIYAKGLVSSTALNVDINKMKSLMEKD